jgi:hypothetical protein
MTERRTNVLSTRPADRAVPEPLAGRRSTADRVGRRSENSGPSGTGIAWRNVSRWKEPLPLRRGPSSPGGSMAFDDELLERTLAFSGFFVSDDGNVTVRRVVGASFEYSGERFLGTCRVCLRARLVPPAGEPLPDVRAAVLFVAAHNHGDID